MEQDMFPRLLNTRYRKLKLTQLKLMLNQVLKIQKRAVGLVDCLVGGDS